MTKRAFAIPAACIAVIMCALLACAAWMPDTAVAAGTSQATVKLVKTANIKNTGSLTTYPGQKSRLKVKVTGADASEVTWASTNKKIAAVGKTGVVKAKKPGRCYVRATVGKSSVKVLVEVTSEEAYQAVQHAFADKQTKIAYSQKKRMKKLFRDCSSFVSRCYWDKGLGRAVFAIGGADAKTWALPAADQAMWLNGQGKRVAWKACAISKLRPGDTLYFETDYAGKDASQWRYIDHAALYVGNGYVMDTGGKGGKGVVGFRWCKYSAKDKTIKFIGRPCP